MILPNKYKAGILKIPVCLTGRDSNHGTDYQNLNLSFQFINYLRLTVSTNCFIKKILPDEKAFVSLIHFNYIICLCPKPYSIFAGWHLYQQWKKRRHLCIQV